MNTPTGIGIFIWQIRNCEQGSWNSIIQKCLDYDIKWIAVKTGEVERSIQWNKTDAAAAIQKCHDAGIKIFGWNYSRPATYQKEIDFIADCLNQSLDGWILDCEIEWQNDPAASSKAEDFMQRLRAKIGNDVFLAHAPFPVVSYHPGFPYEAFGKYVDAVMPQAYWTEQKWPISKSISMTDGDFIKFNNSHPEAAKPVWPIGVSYGQGYPGITEPLTKEDVLTFLNHYQNMPISFYSYDAASGFPQFWDALSTFQALNQITPPIPPPVVNVPPIVVNDNVVIPSPTPAQPAQNLFFIILNFILSLFRK